MSVEAASGSPTAVDEAAVARAAAIREAAQRESPKHRRLFRSGRYGRLLSKVMLPFFKIRTPAGYGVLTMTGRKTGRPRHKCLRMIREGNEVYIVQLRPPGLAIERPLYVTTWIWNIRANPRVRLRLGTHTFAGVARELSDPAELERARSVICEAVHLMDYSEYGHHLRGLPSRAKIKEMHGYWFDTGIPIVVELRS